ncbi:hypothetical protein PLICRDRAFT_147866 [Plicaturopsis crispa FD-325 SS-3]|uniref:ER membrane protein complex subunit 1 n=1 Tax=Plicaturopsis crispa FD-325 SS-3 TaxID=944288 RepID=A0A0C9SQI3_PLICR|nr:hypothetical protein PLICRDRAFT_147866 [Plicaturopsis crispa FD-325 SS-3]
MRVQALLAALCFSSSWALHQSEVGVVDWHKSLVGIPNIGSLATAPTFHRVGNENFTQSVVLTATTSNVLAALDPGNGSVVWRHGFDPKDHLTSFQKHNDVVAALSGPGGATLRTFDSLTGDLLLEQRLHSIESGLLMEPADLGTAVAFATEGSSTFIFVLTNGHTLRKVDAVTGELKWSWSASDDISLVVHSKIVVTSSAIYLIGLAKSLKSYTLHATALSTSTGEVLSSANVPSSIDNGLTDFITVSRGDHADIVWIEKDTVRFIPLLPELKTKATYYLKAASYKQIIDLGLAGHGQFVAIKADGSSRVVGLDSEGTALSVLWDFPDSVTSDRYTDSQYAGGLDKEGWPYVTRLYWSHVYKRAAVQVFAAHLADGKGLLTGFTFPFDTNTHGIISYASAFLSHLSVYLPLTLTQIAADAANPSDLTVLSRLVITTTTGAVQLWHKDELQWTREESLASISAAEFVELPERKLMASHTGDETFAQRLSRQFSDAQNFPEYAVNFVKRFATGSYASVSSAPVLPSDADSLSRDAFGFKQIIVAATPHGKVFGLDSSTGDVLWSRVFGLGWASEIGGQVIPVKLYVTRTVSDGETPQVVVVTQRRASNTLVDTVLFHLDALTGEDALKKSPSGGILQGTDVISGPLVEAFLLQNETKTVVLLDEFLQVYLYPDSSASEDAFQKMAPLLHFPLRTGEPGRRRLMGHKVTLNTALTRRYVGYPTWTASLAPTEDIVSVHHPRRGPVASIGKVLGNRSTLYKYLNPHLTAVVTASAATSPPACTVYLLDGAKGSIVYRATLPSKAGLCDVKISLTDNWLTYHYYDPEYNGYGSSKGYRIVSVELYEGAAPDDKIKSSDISSYSNKSIEVTAYEQSFVYPHDISAITTTTTKFGVTSKDIIVANLNNKIHSIPRRLLDPRRPKRKVTAEEQEEFLIQYEPVLPEDPRRTLSHDYQVSNVRHIVTSPALLESTSLVFAYGLDLFLTRVAPSGTFDVLSENFNKVQLVLTISALAVAIMVTKPMVHRKRLREKWYQ